MDLLRRMLKIDAKERISAAEMLSHPFLMGEPMEEEKYVLSPASTVESHKETNFA
jgi:hypothetical protein